MTDSSTVADVLADHLAAIGVRRIYGIPGGGTTPLIVAAADRGIRFVLTHQETSAAIMASTEAERTGVPGVVVTSSGPGAAAVVGGVAHARLDRAPLLVVTDRQPDNVNGEGYHQWLDHVRLYAAVVKASLTVTPGLAGRTVAQACALAVQGQPGPVHLDVPIGVARQVAGDTSPQPAPLDRSPVVVDRAVIDRIAAARRPVLVAGLGARELSPGVLDRVAAGLRAPVVTTYKGKGAIDETSPWAAGIFMAGGPESAVLDPADVIVSVGLDPVELFASVPNLADRRIALDGYVPTPGVLAAPVAQFIGNLDALVASLPTDGASQWHAEQIVAQRRELEDTLAAVPSPNDGLHPWEIARVISETAPAEADIAVDAGAHMLPVAQAWRTRRPGAFVISNGLATMGCGLPGAIARSIADPARRVICCTGDGGLLMIAGELATAAREARRLTLIVFDDRKLSLIRVKQSGAETDQGVDIEGPNWETLAQGFGFTTHVARTSGELSNALVAAEEDERPHVIVVATDPDPYAGIITTLRG